MAYQWNLLQSETCFNKFSGTNFWFGKLLRRKKEKKNCRTSPLSFWSLAQIRKDSFSLNVNGRIEIMLGVSFCCSWFNIFVCVENLIKKKSLTTTIKSHGHRRKRGGHYEEKCQKEKLSIFQTSRAGSWIPPINAYFDKKWVTISAISIYQWKNRSQTTLT